jgi:hypothetical protein
MGKKSACKGKACPAFERCKGRCDVKAETRLPEWARVMAVDPSAT